MKKKWALAVVQNPFLSSNFFTKWTVPFHFWKVTVHFVKIKKPFFISSDPTKANWYFFRIFSLSSHFFRKFLSSSHLLSLLSALFSLFALSAFWVFCWSTVVAWAYRRFGGGGWFGWFGGGGWFGWFGLDKRDPRHGLGLPSPIPTVWRSPVPISAWTRETHATAWACCPRSQRTCRPRSQLVLFITLSLSLRN